MAEFDEKLNTLLSDPNSMAQIMQLAQSLSGSGGQQPAPPPPPAQGGWQGGYGPQANSGGGQPGYGPPPNGYGQPQGEYGPPPGGFPAGGGENPLGSLLGGLDPKLIARFLPLVKELGSPRNGNSRALLYALQPYLKEERQAKLERALQLARIVHIGKKFIAGWEA